MCGEKKFAGNFENESERVKANVNKVLIVDYAFVFVMFYFSSHSSGGHESCVKEFSSFIHSYTYNAKS